MRFYFMDLQESLRREAIRLRAQAQEKVDAARLPSARGDMEAETRKPEVPIAELLARGEAAAAAQAAKFVGATDTSPAAVAGASAETPETPAEGRPFGKHRRRREGEKNRFPPATRVSFEPSTSPIVEPPKPPVKDVLPETVPRVSEKQALPPDVGGETTPVAVHSVPVPEPIILVADNKIDAASRKPMVIKGTAMKVEEGVANEAAKPRAEKVPNQDTEVLLKAVDEAVDEARRQYVKEDYDNTNRWAKIKNFFRGIKEEKSADVEYYQAQYNNALIDLRNAGLAKIKLLGLEGKELHEALAGTLKHFKYDELVNLNRERTQVRAEHQSWPGKVVGMMEAVGRGYNTLSFRQKLLASGAMIGLAGMTGGASVLARRIFAGAGVAVALEALFEKNVDIRQQKKAEEEAEDQIKTLEKNNALDMQRSYETDVHLLNEAVTNDIFALDEKLQKKKRGALWRKALAFGAGFGGGYFAKELFDMAHGDELVTGAKGAVMEKLGGNEAAEWIKEHFGKDTPGVSGITPAEAPANDIPPVTDVPSPEENVAETPQETIQETSQGKEKVTDTTPTDTEEVSKTESVSGVAETAETSASTPKEPEVIGTKPDTVAETMVEAQAHSINDFVNRDIVVERGDSVWKISGTLADQLGLEGAQKTHFVDAMKDKYGDVFLQEGEAINFSQHGIGQEFVEKALQDARTLTSAQSIAIEGNDARIDAFAKANPEITLTNEVVNNILEASEADTDMTSPDAGAAINVPAETSGQETIRARGISPETIALHNERADDWYAQIFRMENTSFGQDWLIDKEVIGRVKIMDILHDARLSQQGAFSGYTTGLDREQIANFAEFFQGVSKHDIGFDRAAFFREHPHATVMDYLNKVAPLVNQGQRFGLYTTTK